MLIFSVNVIFSRNFYVSLYSNVWLNRNEILAFTRIGILSGDKEKGEIRKEF